MRISTTSIVLFMMVIALILRFTSETTANLSFFPLAAIALFGARQSVQALTISWLFSMLNPGLVPDASLGTVGRYVVICAAALSTLTRYKPHLYRSDQKQLLLYTAGLGFFFLVHSLMFSVMPSVSVLKVFSWTLTVITLFVAWSGLDANKQEVLIHQIYAGLVLVMILGLPLIASPLGYLRNGQGFQGILNHPQAFGFTMSLLGVWAAMTLFSMLQPPWSRVMIFGCCVVLITMSEARTAGLALVGGIVSSLVVSSFLSRQNIASLFPGLRSIRVAFVLFSSIVVAVVFAPGLSEKFGSYIAKRSGEQEILEAYAQSRGGLIDRMWRNIESRPLTGIGFGVASTPATMKITRDPLFDLPVSAPVEKGVLPIAVVEELGVPGFVAVLLWGWAILRRSLRGGGVAVGVLATIVLLNFGEATLFSPGGMGMLSLVLLGCVANLDKRYSVSR